MNISVRYEKQFTMSMLFILGTILILKKVTIKGKVLAVTHMHSTKLPSVHPVE